MNNGNKKELIKSLLIVALTIALAAYVAINTWNDFKNTQMFTAERNGFVSAISQVMTQANNEECTPFTLSLDGTTKVDVINVKCIKTGE